MNNGEKSKTKASKRTRYYEPCRVCGRTHSNPASSSICPVCGRKQQIAAKAVKLVEEASELDITTEEETRSILMDVFNSPAKKHPAFTRPVQDYILPDFAKPNTHLTGHPLFTQAGPKESENLKSIVSANIYKQTTDRLENIEQMCKVLMKHLIDNEPSEGVRIQYLKEVRHFTQRINEILYPNSYAVVDASNKPASPSVTLGKKEE